MSATDKHYTVFVDESCTGKPWPCYGIGALQIETDRLDRFQQFLDNARRVHSVGSEIKWTKSDGGYGRANLTLAVLNALVRSSAKMTVMVVEKAKYQNWMRKTREEAFYKTMTMLLFDRLRLAKGSFRVIRDQRSDRYAKHDEVVAKIANHCLRRLQADAEVELVEQEDSKLIAGVQVIDLMTGAFTVGRCLYLQPDLEVSRRKKLVLARMAQTIGWPHLGHDTWSGEEFNIWHFPEECRGDPESRVAQRRAPALLSREEWMAATSKA